MGECSKCIHSYESKEEYKQKFIKDCSKNLKYLRNTDHVRYNTREYNYTEKSLTIRFDDVCDMNVLVGYVPNSNICAYNFEMFNRETGEKFKSYNEKSVRYIIHSIIDFNTFDIKKDGKRIDHWFCRLYNIFDSYNEKFKNAKEFIYEANKEIIDILEEKGFKYDDIFYNISYEINDILRNVKIITQQKNIIKGEINGKS